MKSTCRQAAKGGWSVIDSGGLLPQATRANGCLVHPRRIIPDLQSAGRQDLATSLNNGLVDEQNYQPFHRIEPERIVSLSLTGQKIWLYPS
jgi:hypothetical protein